MEGKLLNDILKHICVHMVKFSSMAHHRLVKLFRILLEDQSFQYHKGRTEALLKIHCMAYIALDDKNRHICEFHKKESCYIEANTCANHSDQVLF